MRNTGLAGHVLEIIRFCSVKLERNKMVMSGLFSASVASSDVPVCCHVFLLGWKKKLRKASFSFVTSVGLGSAATGPI